MKDSGLAAQPARDTSIRQVEPADFIAQMHNLYDRIACRAFEIFDGKGRLEGNDLDNWLQAEVEVLHPLHIEVSESPEALTVRAEVPGFKINELQVNVEPQRVTITGKRETTEESKTKKTIYSETCSNQVMRVLDLPATVDAEKAKATLKDGVLELDLPKTAPAKSVQIQPKAV